ncbi:sigma-B regulation protein RsbQ [Kineococcus radiotolerans]|uniref:Sigma-B regulation protein RsbQ n=1 Tax=Kineococcus radiotolerans TaxID=131568 RepID=A0A7W4XVL1_KINRA|nr:alpha/beta hydrolase [Kineococcus radiotolerans]MBB2899299.1 sigma-B regulation protein RsbQ [Kineococcus radiotolerans]
MRTPTATTPGSAAQRHDVHVLGHPQGPVLLLLHGFGTDQSSWNRVLPALTLHHRVVLLDQAGAGGFDATAYDRTRYSTLDGYAADLVEVCEELDLHDVTLVGHSVSAMIAARVALAAPDRIRQVVMLVPSARYTDDPTSDYDGGFSTEDIDELLDTLDSNYLSWTATVAPMVMGNPSRPELGEELTASFRQLHPDAARDFARATFRTDSRALLAEVSTPVLVLQSRDDALAPDTAVRDVVACLPHATLVSLDASGHCPHLSHPDATAAAVLAHLAPPGHRS